MKRAKVSTDKVLVKDIVNNFAVEVAAEDRADLNIEEIRAQIVKAGGANYGSGKA